MAHFVKTILTSFVRREGGATAVIYALSLLPVMLLVGLSIDFSRARSAKTQMQIALDSAVLAAAQEFSRGTSRSEENRFADARDVFNQVYAADLETALGGLQTTSLDLTQLEDDSLQGIAVGQLPLAFGGLFGRETIDLGVNGAAIATPAQNIEIVLALDNTTSMFTNNRFNLMREASKGFVNQLFDEAEEPGGLAISVVPWATLVNINSERPGGFDPSPAPNRSPSAAGTRRLPNAPFEDRLQYLLEPEEVEPYTRDALEANFAPVSWRGCIRSAPNERIATGAGVRPLTDDPVRGMRWHVSWVKPELESVNAPSGFNGGFPDSVDFDDDNDLGSAPLALDNDRILRCTQRPARGQGNIYLDVDRFCLASDRDTRVDEVEACVSDPNEFAYFRNNGEACPWRRDIFPWTRARSLAGPNQNCPVAMLGLSEDRRQIIDKLDEMHPVTGGTHMDIGLMWGLRALSPNRTWARFFGHSQPADYDDDGTRKILVILSDGENIAPGSFEGYYGCNESGENDRGEAGPCWRAPGVRTLSGGSLNALTADACTSMRETYGIEVFTIAVDIHNPQALNLLADCATDEAHAFNIRASEIDAVFESIAAQELRLTN